MNQFAYQTGVFSGDIKVGVCLEGASLAEIAASVPDLPKYFEEYGTICVDAEPVPRHMWSRVRPRTIKGREIFVTFHITPRGGGGGGGGGDDKNTFALVASIAVVVVAAAVSGGALGPAGLGFLGAGFAAGTPGAAVIGAGIGIAGGLAIAALTPPPSTDPFDTDPDTPDSASISGNILQAGTTLPRALGTIRIRPPLLTEPLVDLVGDTQVAEAVLGLSGPHQLQDIRMGNIPINEIDEAVIEVSEGVSGSVIPSLVSRQSKTESINLEMSKHKVNINFGNQLADQGSPQNSLPEFHRLVSRDSPDEIWINLVWPAGMYDTDNVTAIQAHPLRIRMRKKGDVPWRNLPEFHMSSRESAILRKIVKIKFETAPTIVPQPVDQGEGFHLAYYTTVGQSDPPATSAWVADAQFDKGAGDIYFKDDNVATTRLQNTELHADSVIFYMPPGDKDTWEIEIKRGMSIRIDQFTDTTYLFTGVAWDFFTYKTVGATESVQSDQLDNSDDVLLPSISSVWNEHPVQSDDFAVIAVKVSGRTLQNISVLASGFVNTWNGVDWQTIATSNNPADHFRDVLVGSLNDDPLPETLLDNNEITAWHATNIANGYQVNAEVGGASVQSTLEMIASTGFARPRQSEKWGVVRDRDRSAESPVMLFSPRNLRGFKFEKGFARRPDGFRVKYRDATANYDNTELIVLDPKATSTAKLEAVTYQGLVTASEVTNRAEFDLEQSRVRSTFYSGEADVENIICKRGDLVAVQHDVIDKVAGFSRILSFTDDGTGPPANLLTITLDGSVPFDQAGFFFDTGGQEFFLETPASQNFFEEPNIGVAIQGTDGSFFVKEVTSGIDDALTLTFSNPFTDPTGLIVPGAHVVTGFLAKEFSRKIVFSVDHKEGLVADITFVDEAPELFPPDMVTNFVSGLYSIDGVSIPITSLLSITRNSVGTATTRDGVILTFAAGQFRITDLGLLVEEESENLCLQSEDVDTTWSQDNISTTVNNSLAPDNTIAMDTVTASGAATMLAHGIKQTFSALTPETTYTLSFYVRAGSTNFCNAWSFASGDTTSQNFTLTGNGTASGSLNPTIKLVRPGVYRCTLEVVTITAQTARTVHIGPTNASFPQTYIHASESIDVWGMQLEARTFPTSYIPTTTAAVTRNFDVVTYNDITWLDTSKGTFLASVGPLPTTTAYLVTSPRILGGTQPDAPLSIFNATQISAFDNNSTPGNLPTTIGASRTIAERFKAAVAYDATGRSIVAGGGTVASDDQSIGTLGTIRLGAEDANSRFLNGYIEEVRFWKHRKPPTELQSIAATQ